MLAQRAGEHRRLRQLLAQLTGSRAAGRLAGSPGAHQAAVQIADHWAALGLEPADESGFLRPVLVPALRLQRAPSLTVGALAFEHRSDFAEDAIHSAAGVAEGPLRVLVPGEGLPAEQLAGAVLLLPHPQPELDLRATAARAAAMGARGLLLSTPVARWFGKSVHVGRGDLPVARLRAALAEQMAAAAPMSVRLELPMTREPARCHNVVATLPGHDRGRALLLSAHYDHVGDDPGGARFPGAFDNASGVALMVQLAHRLARRPRRSRPMDIVFAALTGEESGLHGAHALLQDRPRRWDAAINLDALGLRQPTLALRLGHARPGDPLAEHAGHWLAARGIELDAADGRDDSAVWRHAGIPTLGLGQQRRGGPWPMHTPADDQAALDFDQLHMLTDLLDELITQVPAWLPAPQPHPQPQGALP